MSASSAFTRQEVSLQEGQTMDIDVETIDRMRAVTVSREYGSGGGEIAARLAKRLQWKLVDHAIVERVASEMGTTMQEAEAYDEHAESTLSQVLGSLVYVSPLLMSGAPPQALLANEKSYCETVNKIVKAAAMHRHTVIVGRASQVLLAPLRDVLHVRVIAPFENRVAYVMQREGLERTEAQARIHAKDRDRARYLETEYHHRPDDMHLYDLVLDTTTLGLDNAVETICFALYQKSRHLSGQVNETGLTEALTRYPSQPNDFQLPSY
jgi:CMP/dCMP kinase